MIYELQIRSQLQISCKLDHSSSHVVKAIFRGRSRTAEAEAMKAGNEATGESGAEAATPRPRQMDIKARLGRGSHREVEEDRRRSGPEKQKHDENKRQAVLDIIRHNFCDTGSYRGTTAVLLRKC